MSLKEHIAYGGAASAALAPVFGWKAVLFFLGSIFIDADHYIDFLYFGRFRDWSVEHMFRYHKLIGKWKHRPDICALEAFHTAEFLIGLLLAGLFLPSTGVLLLLAGMLFHLVLDLVRLSEWGVVKIRALSFTEYVIRARRMRRSGVDPEGVFREVYRIVSEGKDMDVPEPADFPAYRPARGPAAVPQIDA